MFAGMTEDDVREKMAAEANGNLTGWARQHGVDPGYARDVLGGRRPPGQSVLSALNLRKRVVYEVAG